MITSTIVQYRIRGHTKVRMIHARGKLAAPEVLAHIVRAERLVNEVMVDVISIKYVYAPQHEWAKEVA